MTYLCIIMSSRDDGRTPELKLQEACHHVVPGDQPSSMPAATASAAWAPSDCATMARAKGAAAAGPLPVTTCPSTATASRPHCTLSACDSMPG